MDSDQRQDIVEEEPVEDSKMEEEEVHRRAEESPQPSPSRYSTEVILVGRKKKENLTFSWKKSAEVLSNRPSAVCIKAGS